MGWFFKISVIFVIMLWSSWVFQDIILPRIGVTWDSQKLGLWGDSFGALNSLFSSLGFVAALFTLRFQQLEIARNRQGRHREDFDKSFFQLLELFREARKEVRFQHKDSYIAVQPSAKEETAYGLEAFRIAWYELRHYLNDDRIDRRQAADIYQKRVHNRSESTLGPYFRLFYTILVRINNDTNLSREDKYIMGIYFVRN